MSVYIPGMEMPTEGGTIVVYKINGQFFAARAGKDELFPLIPVPDHGRLIDADALIADCQLAQKQADRHGREYANAFYSGGGEVSTEWWCVEDMIENAPTIIPAEEGK